MSVDKHWRDNQAEAYDMYLSGSCLHVQDVMHTRMPFS